MGGGDKMCRSIAVIGVGEMAGVFVRGFLKCGFSVHPIRRCDNIKSKVEKLDVEGVLVAVGEKDIHECLKGIPEVWHNQLILIQNELLPCDWEGVMKPDPTVISVWFEKKSGQDYKVIIPSPVFGVKSNLIKEVLGEINIPVNVLDNKESLLLELILKNVYILTTNIAGLQVGGNVGDLWKYHEDFARQIANDVMDVQFQLSGKEFNRSKLIEGMVCAFQGDLEHKCMGRSAPVRLKRILSQADLLGLDVVALRKIKSC